MTHYDFDAHIDKLTAIIARRDAKIAEQTDTIATLRATVADLQADCMMHEKEINNLQCDLGNAKADRNQYQRDKVKQHKVDQHEIDRLCREVARLCQLLVDREEK